MSIFGDRIRYLRQEHHLKQTDFSVYGISQSQLSLIENGETAPSTEKIELLAGVLERIPTELVAGTELERPYLAARASREDADLHDRAEDLARSARMIAVEEAYKRVFRFVQLWDDSDLASRYDISNERYYQFAARVLRRALDAGKQDDPVLVERLHVPDSLMDEPTVTIERLRLAMSKSLAYIQSLILEYAEADDESSRGEIVRALGLPAVDRQLSALESRIARGRAVTSRS